MRNILATNQSGAEGQFKQEEMLFDKPNLHVEIEANGTLDSENIVYLLET